MVATRPQELAAMSGESDYKKRGKIGAISAGRCVRVSGGFKFEMTETKLLRLGRV